MPHIKLVKTLPKSSSYNFKYVSDRYDLDVNNFKKEWDFSFEFPKEWSIGLIVGNSGTGKSLVAREIFDKVYQDKIISKMTAKTNDNTIRSNGDLGDYSKMSTRLILSLKD